MRCKKHSSDLTSTTGVCASCLRERLEVLAEAQAQAQPARVEPRPTDAVSSHDNLRKPEPNHPQLDFPRSVSPYVSRRKSHHHRLDLRWTSTSQVGPNLSNESDDGGNKTTSSKRRVTKFWILTNLLRHISSKLETEPRDPPPPPSLSAATTASPSWFSTILPARRQCRQPENFNSEFNGHHESPSGSRCSSDEYNGPQNTAAAPASVRRSRLGTAGKSISSMAFCLTPLVWASPNRHWSNKGLVQELGGSHQQQQNHISTAASFCTNRSRKLADFGRVNHNR